MRIDDKDHEECGKGFVVRKNEKTSSLAGLCKLELGCGVGCLFPMMWSTEASIHHNGKST